MNDPYPGVEFNEALAKLRERFGESHVRVPAINLDVFIDMPLEAGGTFHAGLRWQQAKYLAFNPVRAEDLKAEQFPVDWPK
jgi:hypothetical protein